MPFHNCFFPGMNRSLTSLGANAASTGTWTRRGNTANVHGDPRASLLCTAVSTVRLDRVQTHDPWTTQFTKLLLDRCPQRLKGAGEVSDIVPGDLAERVGEGERLSRIPSEQHDACIEIVSVARPQTRDILIR